MENKILELGKLKVKEYLLNGFYNESNYNKEKDEYFFTEFKKKFTMTNEELLNYDDNFQVDISDTINYVINELNIQKNKENFEELKMIEKKEFLNDLNKIAYTDKFGNEFIASDKLETYKEEINNKSISLEKEINQIELKLAKMQEKIIIKIESNDLLYDEKNDCYELDNPKFKNLTEFLETKEYFNKNVVEDFIKEEFADLLSNENGNSLNNIKKMAYDKMVEVTDDIKKIVNEDRKGQFIFYNSYNNLQEKYEKRTFEVEQKLEELEKEKQKDNVSFEMENFIL